ncbi:glycoside hydrolase family 9 protein [Chitinibacter bivalviorum]|uniref:Glycoside hydrolase family 9 protein n=1 Tax=Chitinibacter bivalviorum TaxID=2739434 RepID=A0A7H9BH11_9NEIS|nr:glycoside hydrolase family 9 protein [Chitinibacter bivalviorum]QLG87546.1 glycoside hydrolase family 9 protein [Chitinibacter bivalviorum]
MKIILNHLGFEPNNRKTALIEAAADQLKGKSFTVYDANMRLAVHRGAIVAMGTVGNWTKNGVKRHYWQAEFTALNTVGEYFIAIDEVTPPLASQSFKIANHLMGELLLSDIVHYIKGQRCTGIFDAADHAALIVGGDTRRDVHGGWYDASGDASKYLSHLSFAQYMNPQQTPQVVWNLVDGLQSLSSRPVWLEDYVQQGLIPDDAEKIAFFNKWFYERITDEACHGADFLVRMQAEQGYFYMTVFDQWSKDVTRRDICEYKTQKGDKYATYQAAYRQGGGAAIAALARASTLERDGEFSRANYLQAAQKGFADLEANNLSYLEDSVENIIDEYCALLAASELFAVSGDAQYQVAAEQRVQQLLARQQAEGWFIADHLAQRSFFHAAEAGLPYIALIRFIEVCPGSELIGSIKAALRKAYAYELKITYDEVNNPFGYPRQYVMQNGVAGNTQFFIPHDNGTGYWWQGENARLGSIAAAAARAQKLFADDAAFVAQLAVYEQAALDWVLGNNPFDACMLQGWGHNNPRYEPGFFNAAGGVCNGITSGLDDETDIDFRPSEQATMANSWRWTEQWMPHAAWLFLALCARMNKGQ